MQELSPTVHFKKLADLDAPLWHKILSLRSAVFVVEQQCVYLDPDMIDLIATHAFIKDKDQVIGYARFFKHNTWHIGRVVTHPAQRRAGIASKIIRAIVAHVYALEKNPVIEMSAQAYLGPYYGKLGFNIHGVMYLEDGIPHVRMVYQPS